MIVHGPDVPAFGDHVAHRVIHARGFLQLYAPAEVGKGVLHPFHLFGMRRAARHARPKSDLRLHILIGALAVKSGWGGNALRWGRAWRSRVAGWLVAAAVGGGARR